LIPNGELPKVRGYFQIDEELPVLKGHGFIRAADKAEKLLALATEGKLEAIGIL
jgi:hypothetical protein